MWQKMNWVREQLSISDSTVKRWAKEGRFKKYKKSKGGHYLFWSTCDKGSDLIDPDWE